MSVSHYDLVVCACGKQDYTARDAIDAAIFRGELQAKWKEFLESVEAERRSDEMDVDLDEAAISSAADAFRYEYDLITAEETEEWLVNRCLTLDDFTGYFARHYWVNAINDEIVLDEVEYQAASSELRDLFLKELILSGELDRMTTVLMWRVAAHCAEKEPGPDTITLAEEKFFDRHEIEPAQLADWLERLGRDSEWFNETLVKDAAYRTRRDALLVPQARQHQLAALRLSLTRFETEVIEFESRDAAKEALFCVREDGLSMEEVAAEGRYPYRRVSFLLEDIPIDNQQRFLCVSAGQVIKPIERGDGFELCRILNKIEPDPEDPRVRSRIDQRLLDRHFSELVGKHIEYRLGAPVAAP
jgi:catechol 2,3-dioxygenase-like lactoylglutathione lyase family enzyme